MFKNNKVNVSVFGYVPSPSKIGYTIIPLYVSEGKYDRTNRLFFQKDGSKSHYAVVNNMSRLVGSHCKKKAKKYVCDRCLCLFWQQDSLDEHSQYCSKHDAVKTLMPVRGVNDILRFKNINYYLSRLCLLPILKVSRNLLI